MKNEKQIRAEMDNVMTDFINTYPNIHVFNGATNEEIDEFITEMINENDN